MSSRPRPKKRTKPKQRKQTASDAADLTGSEAAAPAALDSGRSSPSKNDLFLQVMFYVVTPLVTVFGWLWMHKILETGIYKSRGVNFNRETNPLAFWFFTGPFLLLLLAASVGSVYLLGRKLIKLIKGDSSPDEF